MNLLLDEHYSVGIASQLVHRGHDALTVLEAGLSGSSDEALLVAAAEEDRALLTNNARHFVPLARRWGADGRSHAGLLLTVDASMPRSDASIGLYVEALEALFLECPGDDGLRDQVRWIAPAS